MPHAAAAAEAAATTASDGGTLYYYVFKPYEHFDPQRTYLGVEMSNFTRLNYRSLVSFPISTDPKEAATPTADLATDAGTASNGAKTWKFTVKDGVKWEDGKAITCEDFKYGASRVFATDVITGGPNYILSYLDVPTDARTACRPTRVPTRRPARPTSTRRSPATATPSRTTSRSRGRTSTLAVAALHMMDPYRQDKDQGDKSNYQIFSNGPYKLEGGVWNKNKGGTFVRNDQLRPEDRLDQTSARPTRTRSSSRSARPDRDDLRPADRGRGDDQYAVTSQRVPPAYYSQIQGAVADRSVNVESPFVDYLAPNFRQHEGPRRSARRSRSSTDAESWINAGGGEKAYAPAESIVNPARVGLPGQPGVLRPAER